MKSQKSSPNPFYSSDNLTVLYKNNATVKIEPTINTILASIYISLISLVLFDILITIKSTINSNEKNKKLPE